MHGHEDCFTAVVDAEEEGRPATTRGAGCAGHSGARITLPGVAALALATIMLTATLVGCGNAGAPSVAPSTIYPETSPTGTLPALKAYLDDVEQVLAQAAATATTLPDAVQGLSRTPDETWASSAALYEERPSGQVFAGRSPRPWSSHAHLSIASSAQFGRIRSDGSFALPVHLSRGSSTRPERRWDLAGQTSARA